MPGLRKDLQWALVQDLVGSQMDLHFQKDPDHQKDLDLLFHMDPGLHMDPFLCIDLAGDLGHQTDLGLSVHMGLDFHKDPGFFVDLDAHMDPVLLPLVWEFCLDHCPYFHHLLKAHPVLFRRQESPIPA